MRRLTQQFVAVPERVGQVLGRHAQTHGGRFAGGYGQVYEERHFRPLLVRVDRGQALGDKVVDPVLRVGGMVLELE